MHKLGIGVVVLALLVTIGAGCSMRNGKMGGPTATSHEPIKIGFVGPLTGDAASIGQNTLVGAEIARDEINKVGGINGRPLELIVEDAKCDPKTAASAGQKLLSIDKVTAIIGGLCSSETLALAPLTESAHVPLISAGSSNPHITMAGDYTFRFYPSDVFQGKFAADYVNSNLHAKKVAILYCQSDYCVGIKDEFKKELEKNGGSVVREEAFRQGERDLRTQLVKIKAATPDLIYFPGYTEEVILGLKEMRELGINIPVLGTDSWSDPKIVTAGKQYQINAEYSLPANQQLPAAFMAEMKRQVGDGTIIVSAPRAYDILKSLANIITANGTDGEKIKQSLYGLKDYPGIADRYTMDANGDMTIANYEVKKVSE